MKKRRFLTLILLISLALVALNRIDRTQPALLNLGVAALQAGEDNLVSSIPSFPADWYFEGDESGDEVGYSVASAGDVNGDGYADVIVGARKDTKGENGEGVAYVFHGSAAGLSTRPDWAYGSGQRGSRFGTAVAGAGDVNGDGYDDVIIGADEYKRPEGGKVGAAFVFYGSEHGLRTDMPDWTFTSDQKDCALGTSVSTAGDVNNDGLADIIIGALWYDGDQTNEGKVFVFHGSKSGLGSTPSWTATIGQASSAFGASVSTAGDVNGDGVSDVIVGAPYYDNGEIDEGAAFVFFGSSEGLSASPDWTADGNQAGVGFGTSVGTAGDVNGDKRSEIIIGAPHYSQTREDEGAAFVFRGSKAGPSAVANWTLGSGQSSSGFGCSVNTAGDTNSDDFADVIVGAYRYTNDQSKEGAAFVFYGSAAGLYPIAGWMAEGDKADTELGFSVGTAGDVNHDGYADLIVGAPQYRIETDLKGRASVYHGIESVERRFWLYVPLVSR